MADLNLLFYQRKAKSLRSGCAPIYLRITVNGFREEIPTQVKVEPSKWDSKRKIVIGKSDEVSAMNFNIKALESKAKMYYFQFQAEGKPISAEIIKNAMLEINASTKTLMQMFDYQTVSTDKK